MTATSVSTPTTQWGPQASLDRVRHALQERGGKLDGRYTDFKATCPVHAENTPSLHVTWSNDRDGGRVMLYCHGCQAGADELAEALGLRVSDLYDNPPSPREPSRSRSQQARKSGKRHGRIGPLPALAAHLGEPHTHQYVTVETYPYTNTQGAIVQEVVRRRCEECGGKDFRQRYTTGDGKVVARKPPGFAGVLYRLPDVVAAVAAGQRVWVCEGEKDVGGAEKVGVTATTNTGGAKSVSADVFAPLAGADVAVVLDRDAAGYARGIALHELLTGLDATVALYLPVPKARKADLSDHLGAGHGLADLVKVDIDGLRVLQATAHLEHRAETAAAALEEIRFHLNQAAARAETAPQAADEHSRFARRWALETEIAWQDLEQAAGDHARAAIRDPRWIDVQQLARALANQVRAQVPHAYDMVGLALPEELTTGQLSTPQPEPIRTSAKGVEPAAEEELAEVIPLRRSSHNIDRREYDIIDGSLVEARWRTVGTGEDRRDVRTYTELLNLDLRLEGREYVDESAELEDEVAEAMRTQMGDDYSPIQSEQQISHYLFAYTDPASGQKVAFRVPEDRVNDGAFLDSIRVPGLVYDHSKTGRAKIVTALQALSKNAADVVLYRGTGWRHHPDHGWAYAHLGGLITAEGMAPSHQLMQGVISRYLLPHPTNNPANLRNAFLDHSASMLDRFSPRVGSILCGLVYCSVIERIPYSVLLQGNPASIKSGLAALAMHHLGTTWDRRRPTMSMTGNGATLNAARILAHQAKDTVMFFDDVTPGANAAAAQARLGEFLQLLFNQEIRDRSDRNGRDLRAGQIPHATGLFSSELMPKLGANARRAMLVPLQLGQIDVDDVIELDQVSSRMARATLTSSYLQWIARDLTQARKDLRTEIDTYARQMRAAGRSTDEADSISYFWAGWAQMTRFLVEAGAITPEERTAQLSAVHEGLLAALDAALDPDSPTTVGHRLRELIASGLRQGVAHVTDIYTDDAPDPDGLAIRLGWRRVNLGPGFQSDPPKTRIEAAGRRVGYVNAAADELLLDSVSLEALIRTAAAGLSEPFTMDAGTARRALHDAGILVAQWDAGSQRHRYTLRRTIHCETSSTASNRPAVRTMTVLKLSALLDDDASTDRPTTPTPPAPEPLPASAAQPTAGPGDEPSPMVEETPLTLEDCLDAAPADDVEMDPVSTDEESFVYASESDATYQQVQVLAEAGACVECGDPARTAIEDRPIHPRCWARVYQRVNAAARGELTPEPAATPPALALAASPAASAAAALTADVPAPIEPTPPPVPVQPPTSDSAPTVAVARPRKTAKATSTRTVTAGAFTHAVVVVDIDGAYLPDGTVLPAPQIDHLGDAAQLALDLNLGVEVVAAHERFRGYTDPGVVVLTDAVAQRLGVTLDLPADGEARAKAFGEANRDHPAVAAALAAGWSTAASVGTNLQGWTKLWRGDGEAYVAFATTFSGSLVEGDPTPTQLAFRLGAFARLVGASWRVSATTTGLDLMPRLRRGRADRAEFGAHQIIGPARGLGDPDLVGWCRQPTTEESQLEYVHAYDRGGSYLAAIASLDLPIGDPVHHEEIAFDKRMPGYWRVQLPAQAASAGEWRIEGADAGDWRYPSPFAQLRGGETPWVTTPTLALAVELGWGPRVLEAYVWPERGRVLQPWYERLRDARAATDGQHVDVVAVRGMIKETYTRSIGKLGSLGVGERLYHPERRHLIIAKARANLLRAIARIGEGTGVWPLAVSTDTVVFASNEPDPVAAWPGAKLARPVVMGTGLGQFKVEGTGRMREHAHFLTGSKWAPESKRAMVAEWRARRDG